MSIAEKIVVIAENEQTIKNKIDGLIEDIKTVNDAFLEKGIKVDNKDYKKALNEAFNIDYKEFLKSRGIVFLFAFFKGEFIPEKLIPEDTGEYTSFEGTYYNCDDLLVAPVLNTQNSTYFPNMFLGCNSLVEAPLMNTEKGERFAAMFAQCTELVTIPRLNLSSCILKANMNNIFYGCTKLKNITFEGTINVAISFSDSPLLTEATLNSIVTALKDLSGQTTQTLTLHDTSKSKLTEEQKQVIKSKNWTLA